MLPIWRALLPLALFIAAGALLDRVLGLDLGATDRTATDAGKWARWALCGLIACFALALHPAVFGALVALALVRRFTAGPVDHASLVRGVERPGDRRVSLAFGVAAAAIVLVVICRPPALAYWDSFVWLGKARIESTGWGALKAASLDRSADVIPAGYPMFWPLASSWLSMGGRSMEALAAGAAAMTLLAVMIFLDAVAATSGDRAAGPEGQSHGRPRWAPLALAMVAITPLVFVHLRSAYADLPVGLLAATCTLRLSRSLDRPGARSGDLVVACLAAAALAGLKDEGMAHVAASAVAVIFLQLLARERPPLAPALAVMAAAAIPFNGWRMILRAYGVVDTDHKPSAPDFAAAGRIGHTVLHHLGDTRSWGALWPIAFACAALVIGLGVGRGRTFGAASRFAALAFVAESAMLFAALLFGPDRVRVFAYEGTLVNRLLIQLAAPAGVVLTLALGDAAAAWHSVRRGALLPLGLSTPPPHVALRRSSE
ncbi:MAG TPA: hypothetical protein VHV30_17725 [Polyangiaceae bacterium]|jgi:hypothetical protein|nr:hypothetical protein [Polyangiaceae bacterium]